MSKYLEPETRQKLQILDDLSGWSKNTLIRVRQEDNLSAARTLRKIIDSIENPVVLSNLKDVLTELERTI
jgi:hypothetical protein